MDQQLLALTKKIAELAKTFPCIEGAAIGACDLNSHDDESLCLPHLAEAILTRPEALTPGERKRLGL